MNVNTLSASNAIENELHFIEYSGINELCQSIAGRDAKQSRNIRYALMTFCKSYVKRNIIQINNSIDLK